jgi:hypothetical protein
MKHKNKKNQSNKNVRQQYFENIDIFLNDVLLITHWWMAFII